MLVDMGFEMLVYVGYEGGVVVLGWFELIVDGVMWLFDFGDGYYFESCLLYCFCNFSVELICEVVLVNLLVIF